MTIDPSPRTIPEISAALAALAGTADGDIAIGRAALLLGAVNHPGLSLDRYETHLKKLCADVGQRHAELLSAGAADDLPARVAALKHVLADSNGYEGDMETYDDLQNADLVRVIERRRGMPVALSILYIHAARAQGWEACGMNIPGHFAVRLDMNGQRLFFDPFARCEILQAADLRRLVKRALGPQAELSATYYEPMSPRAVLIRLQNNVKVRLIEAEEYEEALRTVETMRVIDPHEYRLLLDAGVLYARTGQRLAAIDVLEQYIAKAPNDSDRRDAALFLQQIRKATD